MLAQFCGTGVPIFNRAPGFKASPSFNKRVILSAYAELLWESVLHRYAQYRNQVRGRLLIEH